MTSYTITVVPNDDSGDQTTLVVDTSDGQVRVTDVHLRAPGGMSGGRMPVIDVNLLLRAVGRPVLEPSQAESLGAAPQPAPVAEPEAPQRTPDAEPVAPQPAPVA